MLNQLIVQISIAIQHEDGSKSSAMIKKPLKTAQQCEIFWNTPSCMFWEEDFSRISRSNLLQYSQYGNAAARLNYQKIHRGTIMLGGREAGLLQVLEAGILRGAIQGVILDRGPLWFDGFGTDADFTAFLQAFRAQYPKRFGRKIRFIPEMPPSPAVKQTLLQCGFQASGEDYQTAWLDLRQSKDMLRAQLAKNWRGSLSRAQKSNLEIVISDQGAHYDWLLRHYALDKQARGYNGVSVKLLNALAREFLVGKNMLTASALLEGVPIAAIVVFIHGSSATYQVGYTSETGREKCAHHLLLWEICTALQERAVYDFDLGGVNEGQANGLHAFKKAMGAQIVTTCGLYR